MEEGTEKLEARAGERGGEAGAVERGGAGSRTDLASDCSLNSEKHSVLPRLVCSLVKQVAAPCLQFATLRHHQKSPLDRGQGQSTRFS